MSSPEALLLTLRKKGIEVWMEGGRLRYRAPIGVLGADDLVEIRAHKSRIVELLLTIQSGKQQPFPSKDLRPASLPLSYAQQRLWFIDHLERGGGAYHIPGAVRLQGVLDEAALQASLDTILARHEALRTVFATIDGSPVQVIGGVVSFALQTIDLSRFASGARAAELRRQAEEETCAPFDLSVGPLIRGRLLKISTAEHVLLITMHHIVSDGWSMGILIREVAALYAAYRQGRENPLAPMPIQYADYAVWQRHWLQGETLAAQVSFWKEHLTGAPTLLELPADRPRPLTQSYRGGSVGFVLSEELSRGLKQLSRAHDATLFMTMYAGLSVLLSRLSGQADVVIGTPVANRQRVEMEGLIGFFVNTLALRTSLADNPNVSELLEQVKGMTLAGYSHQDVPFEQIVEALQPPRSLSHGPIFQVMLVLQNTPQETLTLPGLRLSRHESEYRAEKFDLTVSVQETGDRIGGRFSYASDLFDRETIERWVGNFQIILSWMVKDAAQRVQVMEVLTAEERTQLLSEFNATSVSYPNDKLIHQLFEEQVERTHDALAVVYGDDCLTYSELNRRANQLAHYLRSHGVGPDQLVAICVERSVEMVVGLLGILKAGGAYVPLDPSYPSERLQYMLNEATPKLVLTQERLRGILPSTDAVVLAVDSEWNNIAKHSHRNLDSAAFQLTSKHLAYVIYTSGSTGQPKGVMVEHANVLNLWTGLEKNIYQQHAGCLRVGVNASLSFDAAAQQFVQLLSGRTLILIPQDVRLDAQALRNFVVRQRLHGFDCTPSQLKGLISAGLLKGRSDAPVVVLVGGEAIETELWSNLAVSSQVSCYNVYGPTECTVDATFAQIKGAGSTPHIGRPISNTQVYILDSHHQLVPLGAVGEIYIGGAGVARGYLNRPELTTERFLKDPFSSEPGARIYKSGDLGRYLPDGTIEYIGRNDSQVKIRGFRIELGEIETQLTRHAHIKEAVVIARQDGGEKRLVAYYTNRGDETPSVELLRTHLQASLPEYMVPVAYVQLEAIPLTPNGKVDRKALPAPDQKALSVKEYEAPQGEIEETLAGIWQALLKVERVGRHDNFFELGGHSLLIMQLIERLRGAGITTDVRSVFSAATLTTLAQSIQAHSLPAFIAPENLIPEGCEAITSELLPLVKLDQPQIDRIVQTVPGGAKNVQDIYPLAPLQEGILFHNLLNQEHDLYITPVLLSTESRKHLDDLLRAIQAVIDRHDILRTAVVWEGLPRAVQVVYRHAPLPVEELVLDEARDAQSQLQERLRSGRMRMELHTAPLLRVQIARDPRSSQWHALLLRHHLVSDHISLELVHEEIEAQFAKRTDQLRQPVAYREYVAQALAQAESGEAAAYFRSKLADVTEPTAPFGLLDVHSDGSATAAARQRTESALAQRIRQAARSHNVSAATLFHVAWALVVAHTSGRDDVVFGTVLSGRLQGTAGANRIIGMFINTLPLRLQLKDIDAKQAVALAQLELMTLLKYEQASLAEAQRSSGIPGNTALFSALLNYRHNAPQPLTAYEGAGSGIRALAAKERTNYPFAASVDDTDGEFSIAVQTDSRVDPGSVVGYLHTAIESVVEALERRLDSPVLELPIVPAAERHRLLHEFNGAAIEYPRERMIHELFEAQAAQDPTAVALVYGDEQLSYGELNRRANQLAHYLRAQGVGPDQLVGVCIDRSFELVIGLLAILKAGGAYLPLDPSNPRERLTYMLEDAVPCAVLTQQALRSLLPASDRRVIELDCEWETIGTFVENNIDAALLGLTPRHLAYAIYTSGSTGQPKGVLVEHRSLVNYISWRGKSSGVTAADVFLQKVVIGFDMSVAEMVRPLALGARTVIVKPHDQKNVSNLAELIFKHRVTQLALVPSMLRMMLPLWSKCESVTHVLSGGEALDRQLVGEFYGVARVGCELINLYGPTETTVAVSSYTCSRSDARRDAPIGKPISNAKFYVLDQHRRVVPMGVAGELYVGGECLARGYLHQDELTREKFVANPFGEDRNARLYRTGDLVKWSADGNLEYLGRIDEQVKIRGNRIELGEIEAQLVRYEKIKEAVVMAREDEPGQKHLVAYYTTRVGATPSLESLCAHLKVGLPEYMVPAAYVQLETIPLNSNGKVDRKALPAPDLNGASAREYEAPQSEIEEILAGIWQGLLKVERVGRHDNFFELGGHSLLAVQLLSRIRQGLGRELALRQLFEYPTLKGLGEQLRSTSSMSVTVIERADRTQSIPLSYAQQRLWFIDQLEGGSRAYHIPGSIRLQGVLNEAALQASLDTILTRHEALRTVFSNVDGKQAQVICGEARFDLQRIDLSGQATDGHDAEVMRQAEEEAKAPFDLSAGPLIRGRLLKLSDEAHVLLITMHHIVSDGWSMGILIKEVAALYAAYRDGRPNPLAPLPIQYADYAVWQRQWLQGEVLAAQVNYWKAHLTGAPALLELPTDRPRPLTQSYRGGRVGFVLREELSRQLKRLAREHDATLFMTLYAGLSILLSRLSGQQDIVIGTPVANRQRVEMEGLIGFFVNTLALRVSVDDNPSVKALLERVKALTLGGYSHQDVPFEQIVEAVQPPRSLSHGPIFQAMLVLQNTPQEALSLPGLSLARQESSYSLEKFDLTVSVQEVGDRIVGGFSYASDLFDRETIERWVGHFETVLSGMVKDAEQRVQAMEVLTEAERHRLLYTLNATDVAYPSEQLIHELFEEQAERNPDAIAVVYEEQQLTYRQLNVKSNQLAHYLRSHGVGPDQLVAICVERSLEMVVGLLGILKAGGAYVPLDPSYPPERLEYMLKDAAPTVVLTQERLKDSLPATSAHLIALDSDWAEIATYSDRNLDAAPKLSSTHLAYVIYTSGSTGQPKGVMVEHANVVRLFAATEHWFHFDHRDVWTLFHSVAFDFSVWEMWGALLHGGRLIVVSHDTARSPGDFYQLLCQQSVTILNQTPSVFRHLMAAQAQSTQAHSLRHVVFGGEALEVSMLKPWYERHPERVPQLTNMYGITETTVHVTYRALEPQDTVSSTRTSPIGVRIPDLRTYLLDDHRQPVPIGVAGEIYIGGAGVARGYLNRPELTEARFLPDPFRHEPGARIYKSGDLGRYRPDGTIEYIGRNDHQVKIRGFRIELGEIETQLTRHVQIKEAVVIDREEQGERRLVAYYTARGDVTQSVESLRKHLQSTLPDYMVPSAYVHLDALPLTPNGKIDRKALPAPDQSALSVREYAAPQGEIEEILAGIWQQLLKIERVGRLDNFFELGGHSLLAVQLLSRIRQGLGRELELRQLFECPTLKGLGEQLRSASSIAVTAIECADRTQPILLSYAQQRLWFIDRLEGGSPAYHIPSAVKLQGELDTEALVSALDGIVERHEALRTVFASRDGHPVQVISGVMGFALQKWDLSEHSGGARVVEVRRQAAEEAIAPFDLSAGPLIRGRLLRLSATEHVLLITMHHIVSDGWSMGVLIKEVAALYAAYREGETNPLAPLPIQYADYAAWQRQWLQGEALAAQVNYWKAHLTGAPALLELPTDRPRPLTQSYRGGSVGFVLSAELSQQLKRLAREHDATLFMTMYAGLSILLSRLSGQQDIVIGTPVANRQRVDLEGLIGFFVNTLALRVSLEDNPSVSALLERVKTLTLGGYSRQDVPFEQIVEAVQPPRSLSHGPIFQAMLVLQNTPQEALRLPGLMLARQESEYSIEKFDLTVSVQEVGDRIVGGFSYASDLFDRETIERWVNHFQTLLSGMVLDQEQGVQWMHLLPEIERHQLLREFNATAIAYPKDRLIHQLIEEQVAKHPDAIAVVFEEQQLTYQQLNERANQLAHYLRHHGVGPDQLVAICVERSLEMIVGLLGILKAGGAYVPLDPSYPAERLEYMLKDAAPTVVLTQSRLKDLLASSEAAVITLDSEWPEIAKQSNRNLDAAAVELTSKHLAYVIYTSGSTGQPKGVMIEHRNTTNLILWAQASLSPAEFEDTLFSTSLNFDLAVYECFVPLTLGSRLRLVKNALDVAQPAVRATLINTVPSAIKALMEVHELPDTIRMVNLAGEALKREVVERIFATSNAQGVCNLYGPSETTTYSTWVQMRRETGFVATIGRPISNTQIYLLDERRQPVPLGVVGEIYIGGAGVARGYLNRPELTEARFLADPFSEDSDARMYKTGDLGRYLPDGNLEYLGRNDHQVKIRGYRIELGEIESQLTRHEQINEAVVIAREDIPGEKRLVAYYTSSAGEALSVEALRKHLKAILPEYMVPSAYVHLDRIPLTPNGKVDRKALPAPDLGALSVKEYAAPQGEIEEIVAGIWQGLLKVERVGRHDNFFELGGHSLLIVQLIEQLRRVGISTDVRSVFSAATLMTLARSIQAQSLTSISAPANLIVDGSESITPEMLPLVSLDQVQIDRIVATIPGGAKNVQDIYPLAPLQEGILFHHLLNEKHDLYITPVLLSIDSRKRLEAFVDALQCVIDRHDILRTAVIWEGLPHAVQVVYRHAPLPVEELGLDPGRDALEQLREQMLPERLQMDLRCAPLLRVRIAQDPRSAQWYVLLLQHHLVSDHVSLELVREEIAAQLAMRADQLPKPVAYREYVAQALALAQSGEAAAFFRSKLADVDEPTAPFGLLDVHGDGRSIGESRQGLSPELAKRIRRSARSQSVSAATLFHVAWALVVAHTSGREDVVFGTVLSGRLQGTTGSDRIMGMFINTLPLRVSLTARSARQAVATTQRELVDLLKYEQASLAEAQRSSGIPGNVPLFSAMLNYRHSAPNSSASESAASGVRSLGMQERTNYPISVSVDDLGEGFSITAQTDRVAASRVTGYLHRAIESVVDALERELDTPVLQLTILPDQERTQLLSGFNSTAVDYPKDQLIHQFFEEQVEKNPDAIAVVYEAEQLTYRQLNEKSNQLAHYLRSQGVGPDQLVAICVERSVEMIVGLFGILKAGGAYVPLDPSYPRERLEYMLNDAAPTVVLTQARLKDVLPATSAVVIALDSQWSEIEKHPTTTLSAQEAGVTSSHLAYVIYTSGSTGQPKGAMNEHRAVVNRLLWMQREYGLSADDRVLQKTPFSFDVSVWEFFWPLLTGARLVMARPGGHQDPSYLSHVIHERGITTLHFVPSMLQVFLEQGSGDRCSGVRHVVCSGEELPVNVQTRCLAFLPQARLHNLYGPTEAAIDVTYWECRADRDLSRVPIGRPISNTQIYLLDSHYQPVPLGVVGEIYIGGAGVARGYWNRPALTAERFLKDPFSSDPNARLYKSGDLGRYRPDGAIEYLGRNDSQVKIRGFRIELGEIESQLTRHAQIKEAVVIAREEQGEKRLVAYYTAREGVAPSIEALRVHLRERLPEYMVPAAYVHLETIPLSPNGKVDRKALPAPDLGALSVKEYAAPQGEIEEILAGIWQQLLKIERVGRLDNFFELGGHSLLIMQLIERLREVGITTDVRSVFSAATLMALAESIQSQTLTSFSAPENLIPQDCEAITPAMLPLVQLDQSQIDRIIATVPGGARNVQDIYPLAPLQEGILFHHLLNKRNDTYILTMMLSVRIKEQLEKLTSAMQAVIDRHDILRTAVVWEGLPRPVQVVYRRALLQVEQVELDLQQDTLTQMQRRMSPENLRMDLRRAPLIHLQTAWDAHREQWYVLLLLHHVVDDATSLHLLMGEVSAHLTDQAGSLPVPVPYRTYLAQALAQDRGEAETFFRSRLGTIDEPTAPFGLLDVYGTGVEIGEARMNVAKELALRIRRCARVLNVSPASIFHAAWALVIGRCSGREEVVFGSVLSGRLQGTTGAQRALGMFINTLPMRIDLPGRSAQALVEQAHAELGQLLKYEQTSLVDAQSCSGMRGGAPLFTAVLNYRHIPASRSEKESATDPGLRVLGGQERTNYPLTVSVDDLGEGFAIKAQTDCRVDPARVANYVRTAIESMVDALERQVATPVEQLTVLPEVERTQLLRSFNATGAEYPHDRLIHELYEEQVARSPESIAVVYEEEELSYRELNERSNQLAHYLRAHGVGPDELVAICVERSVEMVVGLLGVLKAGGAYVPLDPSYPAERLQYMLKDAAPKVVLTQARLKSLLPTTSAVLIALDSEWDEIATQSDRNLDAAALKLTPQHLAYVIYTSGSTGQPKGVMVGHANVLNLWTGLEKTIYQQHAGCLRIGVNASLSFDAAAQQVVQLLSGRTLIVIPQDVRLDAQALCDFAVRQRLDCVDCTPSQLKGLIAAGLLKGEVHAPAAVLVGGEAIETEMWTALAASTQMSFYNVYGPTECTVDATAACIKGGGSTPHIGRPLSNTQIYLLDTHRQPVPLGVVGEIYIGGAGVARGYLNRPELTAVRFLKDPFSSDQGARIYRSGDLGRYLPDGTLEYLGRNDSQVKIRGFRIELGEIESQLRRHEHIKEAIVIAREDIPSEKRLVAYYATHRDGTLSVEALRSHLKASLPEYMVPAAYVHLGAIPLTLNGKVDRKALPAPGLSALSAKEYEAPQGEIEEIVAGIWQALLKVDRVGRHDNFFELGGHSLLAVQVTTRVQEMLGCAVALRSVFDFPTVISLAELIENSNWALQRLERNVQSESEGRETLTL